MKKRIFIISALILTAAAVVFTGYMLLKKNWQDSDKLSIKEVSEQLTDYKFNEYENLTFDCTVKNTDFSTVYEQIEIGWNGDDNSADPTEMKKRVSDMGKQMFGENIDYLDVIYDASNGDASAIYYGNNVTVQLFYNNTFYLEKLNSNFKIEPEDLESDNEDEYEKYRPKVIKRLKPDDDLEKEIYKVNGELYSLKDAAELARKKMDETISQYLDAKPMLSEMAVIYIPNMDSYAYEFRFSHFIEGVLVDESTSDDPEKNYLRGSTLIIDIYEKDRINIVSNERYYNILEKDEVQKIIPLSEAEKIASDSLAPEHKYTVTECELKYVCLISDIHDKSYFKPMWVFVIDEYGENNEFMSGSNNFPKIKLYIDALTGDSMIYENNFGVTLYDKDN